MFLTDLWQPQPGKFFCLASKAPDADDFCAHFFLRDDWDGIDKLIGEMNGKRNLYFCVHGYSQPIRRREYALEGGWLYADLDAVNPNGLGDLRPTMAEESSPGRYVGLWQLRSGVATWELNQRLTYATGADKSGWAVCKVLRLPDTANLKYAGGPKAHWLWQDGPKYEGDWLQRRLRQVTQGTRRGAKVIELLDEHGISGVVRSLILMRNVPVDRSKVMHRVVCELTERHGLESETICALIEGSAFNKWKGQPKRLLEDVLRIQSGKIRDKPPEGEGRLKRDELALLRGTVLEDPSAEATMVIRRLDWAWKPYLIYSNVMVVAANGGVGKGLVCCDIAARVTTGREWPCGSGQARLGNVLWMESEDPLEEAIMPRLKAAGADMSRMIIKREVAFFQETVTDQWISRNGISLIVLSPLLAYAAIVDHNNEMAVRTGLGNLIDLVEFQPCMIIGIMHPNKKVDLGALERLLGSVAFRNLTRSVLLLRPEVDEGAVRMMHAKHNLSVQGDDLLFSIHDRSDTESDQKLAIEWKAAESNEDPSLAFKPRTVEDDVAAAEWLTDFLGGRWILAEEVLAEGEKRGYKQAAVKQAKKRLGQRVQMRQTGFPAKVWWRMPKPSGKAVKLSDNVLLVDFG